MANLGLAATHTKGPEPRDPTSHPRDYSASTGTSADGPYEVVWSEKPDGMTLHNDLWEYELGNIRDNEQQHYSSGTENVRVQDRQLVIAVTDRPAADQYRNTARHGTNARLVKFNSVSIRTHSKKDFLYGKLEIRARLPKGKGAFPAIWMLGHDFHLDDRLSPAQGPGWPGCGGLDVVELIGTPRFAYRLGDGDGEGSYRPYTLGGASVIGTEPVGHW